MKKKPERREADGFNNPFQPLKQLRQPGRTQGTAAPRPPSARPAEPAPSPDDEALFLRAMQDVKRTPQASAGARPKPAAARPARTAQEEQDRQLFLQTMQKEGLAGVAERQEPPDEQAAQPHATNRMQQLRRGTIRISEELDLHGLVKDEALAVLKRFLAAAQARERQAVLVITGKGYNSPDGPVLHGAVARWLRDQGRGMVAEFAPAPRDKGGSGAYVVFLKNRQRAS